MVIEASTKNNTDSVHILPQGWVWAQLGDVAEYINGRAFKPTDWETSGRPIIRIQNLTSSTDTINRYSLLVDEKFLVKDGDFLISWSATLGAFIYKGEEAILNQHIFKVKPYIDKFFLFYLVNSHIASLKKKVHGTGMQHITKGKFEESPIPLPPVQEQLRIVQKIEELLTNLDAGIVSLKKAQAQLKRYRQAVLKAAFEGRLTREWRDVHKGEIEPASELLKKINNSAERKARRKYDIQNPIDVSAQPTLPKMWVLTQVQNVGDVQLGRQRAPEHHYGPNMRPYLRVANVFENRIDLKDVKSMNFTDDEFDTYHLEYGDILLNEGQSKELVGRPAMFRDEIRDVCFQNTLVRFRVYDGIIPEYALHLFLFYLQNGRFLKIASQSTNIAHLGAERFAKMSFPLAPLTEQKQILLEIDRHISQIDHLEQTITTNLRQADTLRQSILKRAFEGNLVPQDPNDEPASILLERIKSEKASQAGTKKGKTLQPKSPKRKIKNGN